MLYGRQGAGKSTLLLQLAHALATGGEWLGFPVHTGGRVAYVNLDMPTAEFDALLVRGHASSVLGGGNLLVTNEQADLNIFNAAERAVLAGALQAASVRHLIVDTAPRAFLAADGGDVNSAIRRGIILLQALVPEGLLAFSQHDRKRGAWQKAEDFEADEDAFSGPAAWEATVTASFRLTAREGRPKLWVRKCRLSDPRFVWLDLERDTNGFFRARRNYAFLLRIWPQSVPLAERFEPTSLREVLEDVAKRTGATVEAVKQHYYRHKKEGAVPYRWEALVKDGASESDV